MIKSKIYSNKKLIGTSELRITDESMGVVSGKFIPNINYQEIRKTIWDFHNSSSNSKYNEAKKLRINCQLESGVFLYPIGGFLIVDLEELPNEDLEFEAAGIYRHVIEDNFLQSPPKKRIFDPWEYITIEQKISFEDELFKEIGKPSKNDIPNSLKKKKHRLLEYELNAMATLGINDDVLFTVNSKNENKFDYAVIHLTWKGNLEIDDFYPKTNFYENFDNFINNRLNPDRRDWET